LIRKSARGKDFSHGNRTLISDQRNENSCALKPVLLKLGIRVRIVEPEQYLQSIGFLAGNKAFAESPEAYDGAGFDEPMMVMAGFSERKLDLFLTEMRRKKVPPIALKAIVTTQNQAWNSLQLYRELKEEHEKMKSYRK
jgi:hypothetical protein